MAKKQPAGAFSHVELISKDPAKSQTFYEKVFGWKFDDMGDGYMFTTPLSPPSGALRPPQEGEVAGTLSYIEVKDVSKTLKSAESAGAQVLVPKTETPNMGHFAVLLIPGEISQGIYQSA
ncbi:MAG: VOC family protein [Thermoplasmata archaeon]|nr:VOC family protein [Thermoplasmata archaeon]